MPKVVLINPPLSSKYPIQPTTECPGDMFHPCLGLAYLAATCEKGGYEVIILDLSIHPMDEPALSKALKDFKGGIAGITAMTATYPNALDCARIAHNLGYLTVMGGPHVTFDFENTLKTGWVDYVVRGEGEETFLELLTYLDTQKDIAQVAGIAYLEDNVCKVTEVRRRIQDLDSLPPPAYHLLDMKTYAGLNAIGTLTSRGCPFACRFCSCSRMWGRKVTYHSPKKVFMELVHLVSTYDYFGKDITFFDDCFTCSQRRVMELCDLIISAKINLRWKCMTRVDKLNAALLRQMSEAGCYRVTIGIECVTDESLRYANKRINLMQVRTAVDMARKAGLETEGYFIIGFPWQKREDLFDTIEAIGLFGLDSTGLALLTPFPGTDFYVNRSKWKLTVDNSDWERFTTLLPIISTPNFSKRDIAEAFVTYLARYGT